MSQRAVRVCRFVPHDIADSRAQAAWTERHADPRIKEERRYPRLVAKRRTGVALNAWFATKPLAIA